MRGMVTGDQQDDEVRAAPAEEGPADDLFVCTCRWKLYDMGQLFHSKIEWSDPYCRVHRSK